MGTFNFGASMDEDARFERLCNKGMRKDKAARMAHSGSGRKGGFSKYEKWTTDELYKKAVEMGIDGCAQMSKHSLIDALREH